LRDVEQQSTVGAIRSEQDGGADFYVGISIVLLSRGNRDDYF